MEKDLLGLVTNPDPWKIWIDTVYFLISYENISDTYHRAIDIDEGQYIKQKNNP